MDRVFAQSHCLFKPWIVAELTRAKRTSGTPWVRKSGNVSMPVFLSDVSVRRPVSPYRLWGRWRGVSRQPDWGRRMPTFLGGKSHGAFGQPAFSWWEIAWPLLFLKKRFLGLSLFGKTIVREYWTFKLGKKYLISINGNSSEEYSILFLRKAKSLSCKICPRGLHLCSLQGGELVLFCNTTE